MLEINEKKGIFAFFDPNMGYCSFENIEQLKLNLSSLLEICYNDITETVMARLYLPLQKDVAN